MNILGLSNRFKVLTFYIKFHQIFGHGVYGSVILGNNGFQIICVVMNEIRGRKFRKESFKGTYGGVGRENVVERVV